MYKLLAIFALVIISGCTKKAMIGDPFVKGISYSSHPEYGVVLSDHPQNRKDMAECEEASFGNGVVISDKLITNRIELAKIQSDYSTPIIEKLKEEYKERDVSYAHEGAKAAIAVATGTSYRPSKVEYKTDYKKIYGIYKKMDHPKHIKKIMAMDEEFQHCFREERKWKPHKVEWVDTRNGDVIRVVNFEE